MSQQKFGLLNHRKEKKDLKLLGFTVDGELFWRVHVQQWAQACSKSTYQTENIWLKNLTNVTQCVFKEGSLTYK